MTSRSFVIIAFKEEFRPTPWEKYYFSLKILSFDMNKIDIFSSLSCLSPTLHSPLLSIDTNFAVDIKTVFRIFSYFFFPQIFSIPWAHKIFIKSKISQTDPAHRMSYTQPVWLAVYHTDLDLWIAAQLEELRYPGTHKIKSFHIHTHK